MEEKYLFWISDFNSLSGGYDDEDSYWLDSYKNRLTELFSLCLNVDELKTNDIIVINFDTKKLGFERNLQEDTSSYSFKIDHIRYNLEIDEYSDDKKIIREKWFWLIPLLDKKS